MDLTSFDDTQFNNLIAKAGRLKQRREQLLAQISTSEQQISDLEAKAKSQFGDDYLVKFTQAVAQVQSFEESLA